MNFIGIDPSLVSTGIVVLNETGIILKKELIKSKPEKCKETRLIHIVETIEKYVLKNNNKCNIEGLSFMSKGNSFLDLAGLHFLIRVMLFKKNIIFDITPPSSLKKWATGRGNAKKELMLLKAYKKWGIEFSDNNLCDAFLLAMMAHDNTK